MYYFSRVKESGLRFSRNNLIYLAAGLAIGAGVGCLLVFGLGMGSTFLPEIIGWRTQGFSPAIPAVNSPAPEFELEMLSGERLLLSDLRGQPVLINFWATWCGPCRLEMPLIEKYYRRHAPDLRVLAINYDESPAIVQAYVDELDLTFDILLDSGGKVSELYRVRAFPSTFFIDEEGVIRYLHLGELHEKQLVGYLEQIGVSE